MRPRKIHSTEWYVNDSVLIWKTMPANDASRATPQASATSAPGIFDSRRTPTTSVFIDT